MANVFDGNPIYIDDVSSNVDVADSAFGNSNAPMFVRAIHFDAPTAADIVIVKNARGEVVAELKALTTDQDLLFDVPFHSQGLQLLTADQTVTTGQILIYLK